MHTTFLAYVVALASLVTIATGAWILFIWLQWPRRRVPPRQAWATTPAGARHFGLSRRGSAQGGRPISAECRCLIFAPATLGEIGHRLGRKVLGEVANMARPDTILAWYRKLVARNRR
jgi:hypothetical protein